MNSEETKTNLRDYLLERSISVELCSDITGVPVTTIYRVWKGDKKPSYKYEKLLKKFTNNEVSW